MTRNRMLSMSERWFRLPNWGRDIEFVTRRLVRSPIFAATMIGTLAIGLGMFAVVSTAVQKVRSARCFSRRWAYSAWSRDR
jgi:hypothetical protein